MYVSEPLYAELWGFVACDPAVLDGFVRERDLGSDVLAALQSVDERSGADLGDLACAEGVAVPLLGIEPPARYRFGVRTGLEAPWLEGEACHVNPGWVLEVRSGLLAVTSLGCLRDWATGVTCRSEGSFVATSVPVGWYEVTVRAGEDPEACEEHPFAFELVLEEVATKPDLRADVTTDYAFV